MKSNEFRSSNNDRNTKIIYSNDFLRKAKIWLNCVDVENIDLLESTID